MDPSKYHSVRADILAFPHMQGEIYTEQKLGSKGELTESYDKLLAERPEYFVFNGASLALAKEKPLKAKTGETVRIFFGVGGPNYTSSFHLIGEVFERVYNLGSLTTAPMRDVQTTTVPPGGATVVDVKLEVPGKFRGADSTNPEAVKRHRPPSA